jgi:Tfp pilus assembly protein PilX
MRAHGTIANLKRIFCPPRLRDERGMLLVIVMMIMLVVSSLAAANLINAMLERSLAKNQNYASLSLQAAEAGIADGITWLNMNQGLIPSTTPWADTANWPKTLTRDLSRDLNGDGDATDDGEKLGSYSVTMRFKREWRDYSSPADGDCTDAGETSGYQDGDAQTLADCPGDIVLFNKGAKTLDGGFGFPSALYLTADSGYPVVEIDAVGQHGNAGFRKVLFDIARNRLEAQVDGAFTARSGVTATGSSNVDGRNHLLSGALDASGSCGGNKPGILIDDGVFTNDTNGNGVCDAGETHLACDLNCDGDCGDAPAESCGNAVGDPCWDTHDPLTPPLQKTPWGVLGLPQADFESMFTKRTDTTELPCSTDQYLVRATGGVQFNNMSACNNYNGILVIHNENFDPISGSGTTAGRRERRRARPRPRGLRHEHGVNGPGS